LDAYSFIHTPCELYKYLNEMLLKTAKISSLAFVKQVTREESLLHEENMEEAFLRKCAINVLIPVTRDVYQYPELFLGEGVHKVHSFICTVLTYLFNMYNTGSHLINRDVFGSTKKMRKNIVVSGFGPLGLISSKYALMEEYVNWYEKMEQSNTFARYLVNQSFDDIMLDTIINDVLNEMIQVEMVVGTVVVDGVVNYVRPCEKCIIYSGSLLNSSLFVKKEKKGVCLLQYGVVTSYGYDYCHAEKILRTYMVDCAYLRDSIDTYKIVTVDINGNKIMGQDKRDAINVKRGIFKQKLRIIDFRDFKRPFIPGHMSKLAEYRKTYSYIGCHDQYGNLNSEHIEITKLNIGDDDYNRLIDAGLINPVNFEEETVGIFKKMKPGPEDIYIPEPTEAELMDQMLDNPLDISLDIDQYEQVPSDVAYDDVKQRLAYESSDIDVTYSYIFTVKQLVFDYLEKLGLTKNQIMKLVGGGFLDVDPYFMKKLKQGHERDLLRFTATGKCILHRRIDYLFLFMRKMLDCGDFVLLRHKIEGYYTFQHKYVDGGVSYVGLF